MSDSIVSVSRAADLVRRDRQTLYNHHKQGKISFVKRHDDSYGVDVSELQRVYGKLHVTAAEVEESNRSAAESADSSVIDRLRHRVELAEIQTNHANETAELWKERFAKSEATVKMIEHQQHQLTEKTDKAEAQWKQALAERQEEIKQAKAEAVELRQRERDKEEALRAERARVAALESRGFIARLLNKPVTT